MTKNVKLWRHNSLRSRRLELVGKRKNGRARRRHAFSPLVCLPRARPFSLSLTTPKPLLRRLRLKGWRHQNGLNAVFNFKVKVISFKRALEKELNSENRFWLRHAKPERNLTAPPGTILFLKKRSLWYFYHSFLQNKLIFRWHKPFIVGQNRTILEFFFYSKTLI